MTLTFTRRRILIATLVVAAVVVGVVVSWNALQPSADPMIVGHWVTRTLEQNANTPRSVLTFNSDGSGTQFVSTDSLQDTSNTARHFRWRVDDEWLVVRLNGASRFDAIKDRAFEVYERLTGSQADNEFNVYSVNRESRVIELEFVDHGCIRTLPTSIETWVKVDSAR
jgi:hypothetical protein